MPEKKKAVKFPPGASQDLKMTATTNGAEKGASDAEDLASRLANAEWRSYSSRPRVDGFGYFVVLHWYIKEKEWVPLYLQRGQVGSRLTQLFSSKEKEATPIGKYLSSFPHAQRKQLWVKWVLDSPGDGKSKVPLRDVLAAFSAKYNSGETLAFNVVDDQADVPDNFSLLDY